LLPATTPTCSTRRTLRLGYSDGKLAAYLGEIEADGPIEGSAEPAEILDLALEAGLLTRRDDDALADTLPAGYLVYPHIYARQYTSLSGRATFSDEGDKKARNLKGERQLYWALHNRNTPLLVVEGQACAITAWQWQYNAAALCGTYLNERDAGAMQRFPACYLILDANAGDKIARVADVLGPLTMIVADLPAHDLNDWLVDGGGSGEKLAGVLKEARPWIEVAIEQARQAPVFQLEEHLEHLAALVAQLAPAMRSRYVREICDRHRLAAARDFRGLVDEQDPDSAGNGDHNGFDVVDGQLSHYGDPLGNFSARISHELIQDDGLNPPDIVYTARGALSSGEPLEAIDIKAEDFDSMRWIGRHWGARPIAYVSPGKMYLLRRAIQEVSHPDLVRERVHTFSGWAIIDGQRLFLTTAGGLGAEDLDPNVRVDLGANNLGRYALPAPPADLRPAIRASLDFLTLAPYGVTLPLWAAMYAAPLSPIKTLNAVLWVYGTTQSGKSTLSHLALAHFGRFIHGHEYFAPKDWTSTPTDLERAMFVTKDAPIVIDDYAPAHAGAAEARQMARKAHYVVRSVGNRSSRGRANADLTERQQRPPRGLVIATAENPLVGQSIVGRMIYVPVDAGQIIEDKATTEETGLDRAQQQAADGLYAGAMAGYVAWLARNWERLERELPGRIEQASRAARALFPPGQSRLTDYYGLLATTTGLVLDYAREYDVLTADDAEVLAEIYRHELVELLRSQAERVATQSPVLKFFQALGDLLAQEKVYFAPRKDEAFLPPERAELIGWYDLERGYVYLLTNVALTLAKTYWQALDETFDTLADALRRELWQQGFVVARTERQYEQKPYINRKVGQVRVLVLDAKALREKLEIDFGEEDVPTE